MEVLFAAAEAIPFAKTGGLGDVIGTLPQALRKHKIDARVVMPLSGGVPEVYKKRMTLLGEYSVPLRSRFRRCSLQRLDHEGVVFYFIGNEYYFQRQALYGFADDAERFAFFCRAVLEGLPLFEFRPRILHCHDWHTALLSVFLSAFYRYDPCSQVYSGLRTILTIHNLAYQGVCEPSALAGVLGLGEEYFTEDGLKFERGINILQGGIVFSDLVTTVSRTYASEITTPLLGEKLDPVLRARDGEVHGITNGLDYELYNPLTDPALFCNYRTSIKKRTANKRKLQEILGLEPRENTPLLAVVSRLVEHKGFDLFQTLLDKLFRLDIQLVVLGRGERRYEQMFLEAAGRFPGKAAVRIRHDEDLARLIYAGSDVFLMPSKSEPCGLAQLIALRYGSVPVVRETGGLKDTITPYDESTGQGFGFTFQKYEPDDFFFTIKKVLGYYKQKERWDGIVKNALSADFSWEKPAAEYSRLYRETARAGII